MGKPLTSVLPKIFFYVLFGMVPLLLWVGGDGRQVVFGDGYLTVTTLGKIAGVVGLCFFSANLILTGRYHFLDRLFGGLDNVYLLHRRVGKDAFVLLSIHAVLFLTRPLLFSFDAFIQLIADTSAPLLLGKVAYLGFFGVITITLLRSSKMTIIEIPVLFI